ncbi:NAD(P)H-hydrate dehydratase [Desertivirga brevis]|uniref:NAD(P)H-hydrate dehydratase n=1 Tax=Desertivirga brevis TaxID=2810310 RepID=UPI001A974190|nr:NAD(P)H-hydrate dehydratase [Pedobacter sp. SYSU D00873]
MLKLLTSEQTRLADIYTIQNEPVSSVDLMERAAQAFVAVFRENYPEKERTISIYCGTGNNGGDGLAIARLLDQEGYLNLSVKVIRFASRWTLDFLENFDRIQTLKIPVVEIKETDPFPVEDAELIIDALLGTGLNKPLEGAWKELVIWIRSLNRTIVSVDIPTGFASEGPVGAKDIAVKSNLTITFQRPKINFLLPESQSYIERFEVVDIKLDEQYIQSQDSGFQLLTGNLIKERLLKRKPFDHKGTFGHALVVAGAPETMGAALLCSEAVLKTGAGLTTACVPAEGLAALNARLPEVMAALRVNGELPKDLNWEKYSALAIGPGLGIFATSKAILEETIKNFSKPIVFDADALNLLARNPDLLASIPEGSVLTPHVKEFDRLFGDHNSWWERVETGRAKAGLLRSFIILKNRYTIIITPDGQCIFNPTGTPAMASGGMGDVLTGIITSFLAQGYSSENAALLGVYLHGKAGEDVAKPVVIASEVIQQLQHSLKAFL